LPPSGRAPAIANLKLDKLYCNQVNKCRSEQLQRKYLTAIREETGRFGRKIQRENKKRTVARLRMASPKNHTQPSNRPYLENLFGA
jgi:hypothetical protein